MELDLKVVEYNQNKIQNIVDELATHRVVIPPDLMVIGYPGINSLFSVLEGHLSRVNELLSEAIHLAALSKAVAEATKFAYEAKRVALLSSKGQTEFESIKMLEAEVDGLLSEDIKLYQRAKLTAGLFAAHHKVVEGTYSSLEGAKKTLEIQTQNYRRQCPPEGSNGGYINIKQAQLPAKS